MSLNKLCANAKVKSNSFFYHIVLVDCSSQDRVADLRYYDHRECNRVISSFEVLIRKTSKTPGQVGKTTTILHF